jgi:hypothetical protein
MITLGPSLTGLRGTQVMSSIIYTLVTNGLSFLERSNACEGRICSRGFFKVGAGLITRFFEDTWLGHKPHTQLYPSLYNIVQQNQVTVATVLGQSSLNINFSRTLSDYRWRIWLQLVQRLM